MKSERQTLFQVRLSKGDCRLELDELNCVVGVDGPAVYGDLFQGQNLLDCLMVELPGSKQETFYDSLILREGIYRYLGVELRPYKKKGAARDHLLCRCRGIYREEIERTLRASPEDEVKQLGEKLGVAVTCLTCLDDLKKCIRETKDRLGLGVMKGSRLADGTYYRPMGMTPAEFCLRLDQILQSFREESQLAKTIELELAHTEAYQVFLTIKGVDEGQKEYLRERVEALWRERLAAGIKVSLSV